MQDKKLRTPQQSIPSQKESILKIVEAEKRTRGQACIREIAEILKKYDCEQNVIVHINVKTGKVSGDVEIIPN